MKFISLIAACFFIMVAPVAASQKTYVVIGDSIMSFVGDGEAKDHSITIVSIERNVMMKNISSPGITLGLHNAFGYNTATTPAILNQLSGAFSYVDGIIIQAGVNDFNGNVPWDDDASSLTAIINWAQAKGKKVLMLDLIWTWNENTPNAIGMTLYDYRVRRAILCGAKPDTCIFAARPAVFDAPSTTLFTASETAAGKQLHPNVAGQRAMADWIESAAASAGLF